FTQHNPGHGPRSQSRRAFRRGAFRRRKGGWRPTRAAAAGTTAVIAAVRWLQFAARAAAARTGAPAAARTGVVPVERGAATARTRAAATVHATIAPLTPPASPGAGMAAAPSGPAAAGTGTSRAVPAAKA